MKLKRRGYGWYKRKEDVNEEVNDGPADGRGHGKKSMRGRVKISGIGSKVV